MVKLSAYLVTYFTKTLQKKKFSIYFVHQVEEQAQVPEQDVSPPWTEELRRRQLHWENTHLPGAHWSHQLQLR